MNLIDYLRNRGYSEDPPDFYVDVPTLPRCPECGDNATAYISNGEDLVCITCRLEGSRQRRGKAELLPSPRRDSVTRL